MKTYIIYTDGACSGNPGPGGLGYVILMQPEGKVQKNHVTDAKEGYRLTTNNRMEILAAAKALEALSELISRDTDIKVNVYSDSQLVVNTMMQGWAKRSNKDLWVRLEKAIALFDVPVNFIKVKGHANDMYNNMVDRLAVEGSEDPKLVDENYENICSVELQTQSDSIFEPTVKEIRLKECYNSEKRFIEVDLTNGTTVKIRPLLGGFEQYNCTEREAKITVDIAWKFNDWLNGAEL